MSNIAKIEFKALDISGKDYMTWTARVQRHLESMGILDTIKADNTCSSQDKAKANVFINKHLDDMLEMEYFNITDPLILWNDLKIRFNHQKEVLLPSARDEWRNLRFQDFKKVNEYTSTLFRVCSTLEFCGHGVTEEEKLEKTFSTFHASNINLQQQYRLQNFKTYSELNAFLLVAEQNNELLMKNHQSRPTGSLALPEANAINKDGSKTSMNGRGRGHKRGRGHFDQTHPYGQHHTSGRNQNFGRGQSYGRGRGRGRGRTNYYHTPHNRKFQPHKNFKTKNHGTESGSSQNHEDSCFRCGVKGHWSKNCRTPQHLCELYKESVKGKDKEVNLVNDLELTNTELNAADYCNDFNLLE